VSDTANHEDFISSFLPSGYHRTARENADKNNITQTAFGGNVVYRTGRWQAGLNGMYYHFSFPVHKRDEPYNLYSIHGKIWYNFSLDYSYTYKNLHVFGEAAADKNFNRAFIHGILVCVDSKVDVSLIQRTISASFQSINGNAFTENTYPSNETGFYCGITVRPGLGWKFDAYGDISKFPWLKYLVDAPGYSNGFLAQITYTPNKQVELFSSFRSETKQHNQADNLPTLQRGNNGTHFLVFKHKKNWRTQLSFKANPALTLRSRVELLWYTSDDSRDHIEKGFLSFLDFLYRPMLVPYSMVFRIQYFESDSYDSRLYAFENDVLYSYSIPAFYDKGFRYHLTINYDLNKRISCWFRWSQIIYRDKSVISNGTDEIKGNKKSEIKLQVRVIL
jgi:hypothetical protein